MSSQMALVFRRNDKGLPEAYVIEFYSGVAGFLQWSNQYSELIKKVDTGGHWVHPEGFPEAIYETDTEANTIAYLMGDRPHMVAWKLNDMVWAGLKAFAEGQKLEDRRAGRPRNPVQVLQTYRGWTKKADTVI